MRRTSGFSAGHTATTLNLQKPSLLARTVPQNTKWSESYTCPSCPATLTLIFRSPHPNLVTTSC